MLKIISQVPEPSNFPQTILIQNLDIETRVRANRNRLGSCCTCSLHTDSEYNMESVACQKNHYTQHLSKSLLLVCQNSCIGITMIM